MKNQPEFIQDAPLLCHHYLLLQFLLNNLVGIVCPPMRLLLFFLILVLMTFRLLFVFEYTLNFSSFVVFFILIYHLPIMFLFLLWTYLSSHIYARVERCMQEEMILQQNKTWDLISSSSRETSSCFLISV